MAKTVKYKGIIVSQTNILKLRENLEKSKQDVIDIAVFRLSQIGEECVRIARENGTYQNNTGNLRSSIGYVILYDGKPVVYGASKQYSGKKGNGEAGPPAAEELLTSLQAEYPKGIVLIVCAGMKYAVYVEAVYHKDVLTTARLECENLALKLLSELI